MAAELTLREIDLIRVRGRQRPAKIFQVMMGQVREQLLEAYRLGRSSLAAGDWAAAAAAFEQALTLDPDDGPSRVMLERARALSEQPPGAEWDGVWQGPAKAA